MTDNNAAERGALLHPVLEYAFLNDPTVHGCLTLFIQGSWNQEKAYSEVYAMLLRACEDYDESLREKGVSAGYPVVPWVEGDLEKQANVIAQQAQIKGVLQKTLERVISLEVPRDDVCSVRKK